MFSWLWVGDKGDGDPNPVGEVGESKVGDCTAEASPELMLRLVGLLELLLLVSWEPRRDFAPTRLYFCLNLSSHRVLRTFSFPSGPPHVLAKKCAFSRIMASDK